MTTEPNRRFWATRDDETELLAQWRSSPAVLALVKRRALSNGTKTPSIPVRCGRNPGTPLTAVSFRMHNGKVELYGHDDTEAWILTTDDNDLIPVEFTCRCDGSERELKFSVATLYEAAMKEEVAASESYRPRVQLHNIHRHVD
jgi:hypothetical protein